MISFDLKLPTNIVATLLISEVMKVKMTTQTITMTAATVHTPFRRVRSVSLSSEIDCPRLLDGSVDLPVFRSAAVGAAKEELLSGGRLMTRHEFVRALSSNCIDKYSGNCYGRLTFRRISLCQDDAPMEFEDLPEECRLAIFGFLGIRERGIAAQVCAVHHYLLK